MQILPGLAGPCIDGSVAMQSVGKEALEPALLLLLISFTHTRALAETLRRFC